MWRRNAVRDVCMLVCSVCPAVGARPRSRGQTTPIPGSRRFRTSGASGGVRPVFAVDAPYFTPGRPGAGRCSRATGTQTATDSSNEAVADEGEDIDTTAECRPRVSYTFFPPSPESLLFAVHAPGVVLGHPGGEVQPEGFHRRAKLATAPCRSSTIVQDSEDSNRATPTC